MSIVFLLCFLLLESSLEEPILDIKMFRFPRFSLNLLLFAMIYAIVGIIQLILPLFLELGLRYSPQKVGLLLTLLPLASVIVAPIAGSIADRFGEQIVSFIGLLLLEIGCWTASSLNTESTTIGFCVRGILIELGLIISVIPISNTVMETVERKKLGIASGLLALSRSLGIIIGMCLLSTVFSRVTFFNAQLLTGFEITSVSPKIFDLANVPVAALIIGIDTTFIAMALITLSSIMLAVFLWWQSTWYLRDQSATSNQAMPENKTQQN
ncbi:MAG: MFS transporter [Dolichospermum sp.]